MKLYKVCTYLSTSEFLSTFYLHWHRYAWISPWLSFGQFNKKWYHYRLNNTHWHTDSVMNTWSFSAPWMNQWFSSRIQNGAWCSRNRRTTQKATREHGPCLSQRPEQTHVVVLTFHGSSWAYLVTWKNLGLQSCIDVVFVLWRQAPPRDPAALPSLEESKAEIAHFAALNRCLAFYPAKSMNYSIVCRIDFSLWHVFSLSWNSLWDHWVEYSNNLGLQWWNGMRNDWPHVFSKVVSLESRPEWSAFFFFVFFCFFLFFFGLFLRATLSS